ncbi:Xaa-Pro aminopeptidase [Cenarchaeum symbiosum A]|uniref:Xaa-Pro aminopeptidase n=1 Tax=Cenarchaeum symbiosum (strain A) TaxID=414004 RepID=A0RXQ2_CENSY|nr:Xaa-Pro aminopeptidase [Cenarchaeum symbiosum A]
MKARRGRLLRHAAGIGCDSMVAFEPENLHYITGFWGEAACILKGGRAVIIAPELEAGRALDESVDTEVVVSGRGSGLLGAVAERLKGSRPCTDCRDHSTMESLRGRVRGLKHEPGPFEKARMVKDAGEITILRRASKIIDGMFELCAREMKKGQRESELQAALMGHAAERGMFDTGYRSTLNPLIVAGGPNGALPHAQVTGRKFREGDLVVVDLTLRYKGYVSDATRTFAVGPISPKARKIYETVKESQKAGLRAVKPGVSCKEIDGACRKVIDKAGYGARFIHSTGHGIGLEVHEGPAVSPGSTTKLARGMAITVEPGIYIPGSLGVRIEDSLIVGSRASVMHRFTKELVTV